MLVNLSDLMQYAIITSNTDKAGVNIKERLLEIYGFTACGEFDDNQVYEFDNIRLYSVKKESIFNEDIDKKIEADIFIFATTHRSASGIPSLSVHSPGNWAKAELGGRDRQLCIAPAFLLRKMLFRLEELNNLDFEVVQECTHHGPYLEKPCMFIEIGSSEEQWVKKEAAVIIAKTIMSVLQSKEISEFKPAFGIGGLHTTPNLTSAMRKSDYAIGHVCPKYMLADLDLELIKQAVEKTVPKAEIVVLDWKGLSTEKQRIKEMLDNLGLKYLKTKEIR